MSKEKWIAGAIAHRGALHKDLGVPEDKEIPEPMMEAAAKRDGVVGERARLGLSLKAMAHKPGKPSIKSLADLKAMASQKMKNK